jgi:hypothetical protein
LPARPVCRRVGRSSLSQHEEPPWNAMIPAQRGDRASATVCHADRVPRYRRRRRASGRGGTGGHR